MEQHFRSALTQRAVALNSTTIFEDSILLIFEDSILDSPDEKTGRILWQQPPRFSKCLSYFLKIHTKKRVLILLDLLQTF